MENAKLVDKLKDKANLSYEEARIVLEQCKWDILESIIYLEEKGIIDKPSVSIFYSNESEDGYKDINDEDLYKKKHSNNYKKNYGFEGIFEAVCNVIDTGNNIFFEIKREGNIFLRIPITVMILLLMFTFWFVIPLAIIGLFFDIEFFLTGKTVDTSKINEILKMIAINTKKVKEEIKKGLKHG